MWGMLRFASEELHAQVAALLILRGRSALLMVSHEYAMTHPDWLERKCLQPPNILHANTIVVFV